MSQFDFIDLRKELEFLRAYEGHRWLALRIADLSKPCKAYMDKEAGNYDQPAPYCKSCLGIGYSYIDKLIKGFRYQASPTLGFKGNIGVLDTETKIFILEYDAIPKRFDWILELDLDENTMQPKQPFRITNAFKIEDSLALRGEDGRIEFFRCNTKARLLDIGKRIA